MLWPLKPGISSVDPFFAQAGSTVDLKVNTYNGLYNKELTKSMRAWLKIDSLAIEVKNIKVTSTSSLELNFDIPILIPNEQDNAIATLIIDDPENGTHLLPEALAIRKSENTGPSQAKWEALNIGDLHKKEGIHFPYRNLLQETIRNTYFHVALWFSMIFLFIGAIRRSSKYLRSKDLIEDQRAASLTSVGILFGLMGLTTGAVWARFTWGSYWSGDIKQNMTAIALLIYMAYFVLRSSIDDPDKKARISAVYNIFAFAALILLIYVVPRLTDSLHPGAGGNPAFGGEDLDNTMRMVFYPIIIGWTLIGFWIAQLGSRIRILQEDI